MSTETLNKRARVLVVGAGPVGLFLALKIAQAGIETVVIESEPAIVKSPRATA
jgi:2-polyprenyl-6-methoxyphenol hydroxylase-like FAD-dependent oxidoreductase